MLVTQNRKVYYLFGIVLITSMFVAGLTGAMVATILNPQETAGEDTSFTIDAFFTGFVGASTNIQNEVNPDLVVPLGSEVTITLVSGEIILHNFAVDEFGVKGDDTRVSGLDEDPTQITFTFTADQVGIFTYYCAIPGHFATMNGRIIVGDSNAAVPEPAKTPTVDSIMRHPTDIAPPVGNRAAKNISITIVAQEVIAEIEPGTTMTYWTFNYSVPGPLIRVRVGDNVTLNFMNNLTSEMIHSIDLHAVTDTGGGATYTQTNPGETTSFSFNASHQGTFIYHCASPHVPTHISVGMYGAISVEPAGGLPAVDKEFYIGQSEVYTKFPVGTAGHQEFNDQSLLQEEPTYVLFNGMAFGLTNPAFSLNATKNDDIRIFFGVGGPNLMSSFHIIGEVFDEVYYEHSDTPNMKDAETIVVPPGSALTVMLNVEKVGTYILVDHALSRAFDKGAIGFLYVKE